jgi:phosphoglycolate phosphatase-like HAD superfamily hydrolase
VGHCHERAQGNRGACSCCPWHRHEHGVYRDRSNTRSPIPTCSSLPPNGLARRVETAVILGDAIWDMLAAKRCKALGVGLLSGGYGSCELQDAGAIRVHEDPADVLRHIDEIGGRR